MVATEKLEVKGMTSKAKKGQRKKQKAGLNKSILDVGFGMLRDTIKYKIEQIGGVFIEVPTRQVKILLLIASQAVVRYQAYRLWRYRR